MLSKDSEISTSGHRAPTLNNMFHLYSLPDLSTLLSKPSDVVNHIHVGNDMTQGGIIVFEADNADFKVSHSSSF